MLDGAGGRAAGRIWSVSHALSRCLHASIAVGRMSKPHPITVIPPVASLPETECHQSDADVVFGPAWWDAGGAGVAGL